ncbi:hypothetical protein AAHE18_01G261900 [Arachis hypogaea]
MGPNEDRSEIVFFDVETTVPTRPGQGFAILEFGAILVCPRTLTELRNYSTLVRPADLSLISPLSERCNGITADAVAAAPTFADIADAVYDLLHGRIWAGHNILRFDCARIREAFAAINQQAPEPKGAIDSLVVLTQKFGRRAGNMKMASLATYFGLGQQTHRSLDDVRMNLEVLKYCSTVLFLESSLPDILTANSWISPNAITRSRSNGKSPLDGSSTNMNKDFVMSSSATETKEENHPILSLTRGNANGSVLDTAQSNIDKQDSFDLRTLGDEIQKSIQSDVAMDEKPTQESTEMSSSSFVSPASSSYVVLEPDEIFLDACDSVVQKLSVDSGSSSDWRPVVIRKEGFFNYPTARLHIPTAVCGDVAFYATEIYQRESSGTVQRLLFSKFDAEELGSLFTPGTFVDAFFSLDPYDYQQNAGIKLVAKKLIIDCK